MPLALQHLGQLGRSLCRLSVNRAVPKHCGHLVLPWDVSPALQGNMSHFFCAICIFLGAGGYFSSVKIITWMEDGWEGTKGKTGWQWKLRALRVPRWKSHRSWQLKTLWKYREGILSVDLEENYWPQSSFPSPSCSNTKTSICSPRSSASNAHLEGLPGVMQGDSPGLPLAWLLSWTAKSQRRSLHSHQNPSRSLGQFYQCSVNGRGELTSLPQAQKHKICEVLLLSDCSQNYIQILQKGKKPKHNKGYENQPKLPNPELSQSPAWDCHSCRFRFQRRILNTVITQGKVRGERLWLPVLALKGFSGQILELHFSLNHKLVTLA